MPLAMLPAPGGEKLIVSLGGWREQGIQVINLRTRRVDQTLKQDGAFFGLAFSRDGRTLYASGGNEDSVYCYDWDGKTASLRTRIELAKKEPNKMGSRYPAGLGVSNDGRFLYVAENVGDALAVVDLTNSTVVERLATEHYPYAVAVARDGAVYVSAWAGKSVSVFRPQPDGQLSYSGRIGVGRHPSAMALNASGSRLFVALASVDQVVVVDTRLRKVVRRFTDAAPGAPQEGSTPNALALSADESKLFVAEADSNAVAVFDLVPARRRGSPAAERPVGRIPTDWYPTSVLEHAGRLLILCGKGQGTSPNPDGPIPGRGIERPAGYTLGQLNGTLRLVPGQFTRRDLAMFSRRVAAANDWDSPARPRRYPPFRHVVYIIKENRTYDQVFGDLPQGDGDPSLLFFGRDSTPNHRALAARFGLFDRFFTNAEVSSQGHIWSTAAYVTDYGEKTIPSVYSDRRPDVDEGDADEPTNGFLWTLALNSGVSFRDYGEWVQVPGSEGFSVTRPGLRPDISTAYPPFDMSIPDQRRADVWIAELQDFIRRGEMPQLEIMHLPGDHTAGAHPGMRTPRACMADNDLALGRIVEALSRSPFWRDTVIFVLEDDAQAGPDHFDSHRSPLLVISAYNRPGTISRFVNTTDVIAAIEDILRLGRMSQYDYFSRPLSDVFARTPDLTPYVVVKPAQPLDEKNPVQGPGAEESMAFDLSAPDRIDDAAFNRGLWKMIKGEVARMPAPGYASPVHLLQMRR
ncbi:MAG TPA: alkaline phosphatase family protein [Pyrinomonadaceae bacterium]|jgi:sugar lactone lactonase YvrE